MERQKRQPLSQMLHKLAPGLLVDSAWLQMQGVSRTSIHDYVRRGWLERVASRVYRRTTAHGPTGRLRWELAIMSVQSTSAGTLYIGGMTALELHGLSHFARLGNDREVHLYDPDHAAPTWLATLPTDATLVMHRRGLCTDPLLGTGWHRLDLGTRRLGAAVPSPDVKEAWDHFVRVAGPERAAIEMMEDVPTSLSFDHADKIFENLATLRPRLVTALLEQCSSIRAKRLFLFFADRHDHSWSKRVDRSHVELARGKRQLVRGGRLDPHYQITVPDAFAARAGDESR